MSGTRCTLHTGIRIDAVFIAPLRSAPWSPPRSITTRTTATSFGPRPFAC